jgi:hypothetical protein
MNQNKTLQTVKVGNFEIRLSVAKIEIETNDRSWKQVHLAKTRAYAELVNLIARDNKDAIGLLCNALYSTTIFFYDQAFCMQWVQTSIDYVKKMKKNEAN